MNKFIIIVFCIFLSCKSQKSEYNYADKKIKYVDFCDLENHKNELVATEFYYTGFVEYWWIYSKTKYENNNVTNLAFDIFHIPTKFKRLFDNQISYDILKITAIGKFRNNNINGYGHEGSNKSEFLVLKIFKMKKAGKMKIKQ
ncbi:MAG: hypothetical protein H7195_06430 [Chryseobacterium sp.]|nr:hypothetical protein [Chryseobacterium sp.]